MSDGLSTLTGAANIGAAGSASRSACRNARCCLSRSLRSILSCSSCLGFCDFFISKPRPPPLVDCSDVEDRDDDDDPPSDDPDDDDDGNENGDADDDAPGPVPAAAADAPKVPATELNEYRFLLLFIAHLALHITTESESFRS